MHTVRQYHIKVCAELSVVKNKHTTFLTVVCKYDIKNVSLKGSKYGHYMDTHKT